MNLGRQKLLENKGKIAIIMSKLSSTFSRQRLDPNEGSGGFVFEEDEVRAFGELSEVLRGIHNRLISEGYEISNGVIFKKADAVKL